MSDLELKCINTIRVVSAEQPQAANSGHPGAPMGCAPMAHALWTDFMSYSSTDPAWINRDRFVLSNGHACALQYTMLHLTGYNVTKTDLSQFRRLGSKTPGHPECFVTDGMYTIMLYPEENSALVDHGHYSPMHVCHHFFHNYQW
jgi:transketolase